ncbi:MAG: hypothetical protein ACPGQL_08430 [Thermoplasmatota archaeon]
MRRNTLLAGLLTTALLAASAPADAAVFLKLPGVEGEVHDDNHAKWIEVLSYGDVEEDETTSVTLEYLVLMTAQTSPDGTTAGGDLDGDGEVGLPDFNLVGFDVDGGATATSNGGNPVQLYTPTTVHVSADSFFDIFVEANVDSTGGRNGDSFFDIFIEDDWRNHDDAGGSEGETTHHEIATPAGSVSTTSRDRLIVSNIGSSGADG